MSRRRQPPIPLNEPAWLVLMDYGGYSVWMTEEKARKLARSLNSRAKRTRAYIVRRKVKP